MGLTSTIGHLSAIAGPHAVGALTSRRSTRSEWQNVFFLAAGIQVVGAVIFVIFGSGNRQHWADDASSVDLSGDFQTNKKRVRDD